MPPLRVCGSVFVLADVAREVGGDQVKVSWIVDGGDRLERFAPTPSQLDDLRVANLVLTGGITEPWAIEGYDNALASRRVLRIDAIPGVPVPPTDAVPWLDPVLARQFILQLQEQLVLLRPEREADFRSAGGRYLAEFDALLAAHEPALKRARGQSLISTSDGFELLWRRYGIEAISSGTVAPQNFTEQQLREVKRVAQQRKVGFIALNSSVPGNLRQWIGEMTGLSVIEIDLLGSSSPVLGRDSFLKVLKHNLQEISRLGEASGTN